MEERELITDKTSDMVLLEASKRDLIHALRTLRGSTWMRCTELLRILQDSVNPQNALQYLSENFEWEESAESEDTQQKVDESNPPSRLEPLVQAMLTALIDGNPTEEEFYSQMWSTIQNPLFDGNSHERAFALKVCLEDSRIPYFEAGTGLKMSNEDYKQLLKSLRRDIARVKFHMARPYSQKTERADILLSILLEQSDTQSQVVLLSQIIGAAKASGLQDFKGVLGSLHSRGI